MNLKDIGYMIKTNEMIIENYVNLVNRTIDKEFSLIRENNELKKIKKEQELRSSNTL